MNDANNHGSRRLLTLALLLLTLTLAAPAAGQNIRLQSQSSPQPVPPATELAVPEPPRQQDNTICEGVQLYWTLRGLAFGCADFQAGTNYMMVINAAHFPGGVTVAAMVLDRLAIESRDYIMDPQKPGISLKVRFREPDAQSTQVCQLIQGPSTRSCREVVHFYW